MFFKKEHATIAVEFADAGTGRVFAKSNMPVTALPDSFEAETTLQLEGDDWQVVRAEPVAKSEFAKLGRLSLWLTKVRIEMMDASQILFSLPTINDELPSIAEGSSKLDKAVLELHEDDWRQIEFVSLAQQAAIDEALAQIERIFREEQLEFAFRKLHVRTEIPRPLEGRSISFSSLQNALAPYASQADGVAFQRVAGLIDGGFTLAVGNSFQVYGVQHNNTLESFCLTVPGAPLSAEIAQRLAQFAAENDLCLIDWCRAVQLLPQDDSFLQFFMASVE